MSMPGKKRPTASAPSARAHLEQAIALYDPQQHRSLAFTYGEQAGVHTRGFAAHTLWYLGYPDQALEHFHRAGLGIEDDTAAVATAILSGVIVRNDGSRAHTSVEPR